MIGLHGGALLGVAYRTSRRISPAAVTAISTIQPMPLSGLGSNGLPSLESPVPEGAPQNFQLYRFENYGVI